MGISERLKQIRLKTNLSQTAFAEILGLAQTTYGPYETGRRSVPDELKFELSQKYNINIHWLVTGEGNMFLTDSSSRSALITEEPMPVYNTGEPVTSIPILSSKISAGNGEEWLPDDFKEDEFLPVANKFIKSYNKKNLFAAEVRGDSMIDIQLFGGDVVFAVKGKVEGDGIYVITVDQELFVKRISYDPFEDQVHIISENPKYETKIVDSTRVTVLGKVIGWLHRHPF